MHRPFAGGLSFGMTLPFLTTASLQGTLGDFVPAVGLTYFTHQTLPQCLFVPIGALIRLQLSDLSYTPVTPELVLQFDR